MEYADRKFENETIQLDGNRFDRCKFEKCTFVFRGAAPFGLSNCSFSAPQFQFTDSAGLTVEVLVHLRNGGFAPVIDKLLDGIKSSPPPGTPTN